MSEWVGLNAQPPDIMGKLSQLLQIQSQRQALAGQAAEVQMTQQTARQRAALANYDFGKHVGEDGTVDLNSLTTDPELRAAAGDLYLEVLSHAANAKQQQLEAKSKLFSLRGEQVSALGQMITPLLSDKDVAEDNEKGRQKLNDAWIQYGQLYGEEALPVLQAYANPLRNIPQGKLPQALRMIQMQAMDVEKQRQARLPVLVNRGGEFGNINPDIAVDAPSRMSVTLPPGASIVTDQKGAQFVFDPQRNTVSPVGTGRGAGPSSSPSQPVFQQPSYVGQEADIRAAQTEVASVRAAAQEAPLNRNIYGNILGLLKEGTKTGPLVSYLQNTKIGGQVFGDNYQELGKFLEKNALANMAAMGGPPSDARLSAASAANGSTEFNPKALRAVTEFNYATNTALEKFREGMDKAVGVRNPDYSRLPEFKAAWAANFDVDVFRLENAVAEGDKKAQQEILSGLSPSRRRELAQKMRNLDALSNTGRIAE